MRHHLLAAAISVMALASTPDVLAGGYSHGNGSGSCSFTPGEANVGQMFRLDAVGLPTDAEVDLIVTNYEATTHVFGPLTINPDGTWSGAFSEPNDGWWNFDFVSPSSNSTRLPNSDASCKIRVH